MVRVDALSRAYMCCFGAKASGVVKWDDLLPRNAAGWVELL